LSHRESTTRNQNKFDHIVMKAMSSLCSSNKYTLTDPVIYKEFKHQKVHRKKHRHTRILRSKK